MDNASGIEDFNISNNPLADILFCEVSITSLLAVVHFVPLLLVHRPQFYILNGTVQPLQNVTLCHYMAFFMAPL